MSDEIVVHNPETEQAAEAPLIHLVARNPQEMAQAQANMTDWFIQKIALVEAEANELDGAAQEAAKNGWKYETLERQHKRALGRKLFYEKCLAATKAGYTIIPEIPIDVFAIRTSRKKPLMQTQQDRSELYTPHAHVPAEPAQVLPVGEGEYKSPEQLVQNERGTYKNDKGKEVQYHNQWAVDFDSIEFPAIAAVPYVMSATQQAMAARVFDEIGISPQGSVRAADPLIIGRILGPRRSSFNRQRVSFLIAWHLDLRTL